MSLPKESLVKEVGGLLENIQTSLYERALKFREDNTVRVDDYQTLKDIIANQSGFLYAFWCGDAECEDLVKQETMATIRCIPLEGENEDGACVRCGKTSRDRVYFAKAY
jgi:prolyl-tRNA synthetase